MRVTQLCNTLSASDGGPARHALEVNAALNRLGVDVQLYSTRTSIDALTPTFLAREGLAFREPKNASTLSELVAAVKRADAVIIHGYFLGWVAAAVAIARLHQKPVLLMPHGALTSYDRSRNSAKKDFFHLTCGWWINRSVRFVVATERESADLKRRSPHAQVTVVGAGASSPAISPEKFLHTPISLLSLSRIASKKRIDLAIRTLSILRKRGVDAILRIGGEGQTELTFSLQRLAEAEGIDEHVQFVGHVEGPDKESLFETSDILLLLSDDENFGIGLAEALSRGLPAVTTTAVEAASSMSPAFCPRVVPGDAEGAADQVQSLADGYHAKSKAAIEAAHQAFSWDSVAKRWAQTLDEIASGHHSLGSLSSHETDLHN